MDVVVTVPQQLWADWCAEGDLPGDPETGDAYHYYLSGGAAPNIQPGDRVYIVARGWLRGYAPLTRLAWSKGAPLNDGRRAHYGGRFALERRGGAVAVTLNEPTPGFRGWRYRWWKYEDERPYDWAQGPEPGGRLFEMPLPGATPSG